MSRFLVTVTVPMFVEFQDDEKPTERSAEYVATAIGLGYLSKDGTSRELGWFKVYIDDPKKIVVVSSTRVDIQEKNAGFKASGVAPELK